MSVSFIFYSSTNILTVLSSQIINDCQAHFFQTVTNMWPQHIVIIWDYCQLEDYHQLLKNLTIVVWWYTCSLCNCIFMIRSVHIALSSLRLNTRKVVGQAGMIHNWPTYQSVFLICVWVRCCVNYICSLLGCHYINCESQENKCPGKIGILVAYFCLIIKYGILCHNSCQYKIFKAIV